MKADEAPTSVLCKYTDFADIFFKDLVDELLEYTEINNYVIELVKDQQSLYISIYSLETVELETFKTYIKTNLAIDLIKSFKSFAGTSMKFVKKLDGCLLLYVNY